MSIIQPQPKALVAFKLVSQGYFTAYIMSSAAMEGLVNDLDKHVKDHAGVDSPFKPTGQFQISGRGSTEDKKTAVSSIPTAIALDGMRKGGVFSVRIAQGMLGLVYAAWENDFRHQIAEELGVKCGQIKCDVIGDIRLLRHEIHHNNAVIREKDCSSKMKILNVSPGPLELGNELMYEIQEAINTMQIYLDCAVEG